MPTLISRPTDLWSAIAITEPEGRCDGRPGLRHRMRSHGKRTPSSQLFQSILATSPSFTGSKSGVKNMDPLLRIPFDALFEIMKDLEWLDILRLRQTCRHLKAASDDRSVWLHLYTRYRTILAPMMHWPDRPLDLYNIKEFQELVLQPFKVDRIWKTDNIEASSRLSFPVGTIYSAELIRGGRWLLTGTDQGEILYFDLDAPTITPRVLIPSAFGQAEIQHVLPVISIDMEDDAPYLTFNIAIVSHSYGAEAIAPLYGRRPIQVWRVRGVPDVEGRIVDLQSENLATFYEDPHCLAGCLSLRGNLLAYFRRDFYISVVVDWTMAKGSTMPIQKAIVPPEGHEYIHLLPNDWIMCAGGSGVYIYALEDLSEKPDYAAPTPIKAQFPLMAQGSFTPFEVGDSTRFIFRGAGGKTVGGLSVPHSDPVKASITTLHSNFPCEWNDKVIASYNDAVIFHPDGRFSVATYSWDGAQESPMDSPKAFYVSERGWCIVDRSSGRIVVLHRQGQEYGCVAIGL